MPEPLRVLVTRTLPGQLGAELRARGCEVVHLPLIELFATTDCPPSTAPPLDGCVVTSAAVVQLARHTIPWLQAGPVWAVGSATARALAAVGVEVHHVALGTGADLLAALPANACPWFVGARRPAPAMAAALEHGRLVHWPVYDRRPVAVTARPHVDVVTLTSPSAARTWASNGGAHGPPCVVIGPTTRHAAERAGLPVAAEATSTTMTAVAEAVISGRWRG